MSKLYLFPVSLNSINLARKHAPDICDNIRRSYPDCRYLEKVGQVINGSKVIHLATRLPAVFRIIDDKRPATDERELIANVTSCLDLRGIEYKEPLVLRRA